MNATQQLQRVTPKQAERLRKLGFDWECLYYYANTDTDTEQDVKTVAHTQFPTLNVKNHPEKRAAAPAVAHALKWCDEEKGVRNGFLPKKIANQIAYCWWCSTGSELRSEFVTASGAVFERDVIERILLDKVLDFLEQSLNNKTKKL